jgi:cysteine desulfurase / selenocysteine lyase
MLDIDKARHDTPGCENVTHFNNAGASLMTTVVRDTVVNHLDREMLIGGYEAADEASGRIKAVYNSVATFIGASAGEISLMTSATHAWVQAFYAIPFKAGDKILTVQAEYAANFIAFLQVAQQSGVEIVVIPSDETGQVSVSALQEAIDDRVKLIAMTHVPTNGGLVNPAETVGHVAREHDILYLLDACQSVGQMPIDVKAIGCDILSATGRKYLRGPRGTGFLYVRREVATQLSPPTLDLHSATWIQANQYEVHTDGRRFEKWESSIASRLGLGAAVDYALSWGIDAIWKRIQKLADELRQKLSAISSVTVHDLGLERCGIVTFDVDGHDAQFIKEYLAKQNINVSTSTRFSTRIDMEARGLDVIVRASVHYFNTLEEIDRLCAAIDTL